MASGHYIFPNVSRNHQLVKVPISKTASAVAWAVSTAMQYSQMRNKKYIDNLNGNLARADGLGGRSYGRIPE